MIEALLAAALALPGPWYAPGAEPETPEERAARVEVIVSAAVAATEAPPEGWPGTSAELAALVLATTWGESRRWAVEVHDGRVRGDRGRSCGLGQLWGRCDDVGTGRAETERHMRDVASVLAMHAARCRVRRVDVASVRVIVGGYGTGWACRPIAQSWPRARRWAALLAGVTVM